MWQMSEVFCSSSGQGFHPELPDVLELLGSRPYRVLPLVCSYTGHTSITYAPSELTLTHVTNVRGIICRPPRVHLELSSRVHLEVSSRAFFLSDSSRAIFLIGTWSLLLSTSSLKLRSRSFNIPYIHTSRELHFISLALCDLIVLSSILLDFFDPQLLSCFFERYRLGISQTVISGVLRLSQTSPVHLNFLGVFDMIS
jgi:hypothetical protein